MSENSKKQVELHVHLRGNEAKQFLELMRVFGGPTATVGQCVRFTFKKLSPKIIEMFEEAQNGEQTTSDLGQS